jgi:hypothetical protein
MNKTKSDDAVSFIVPECESATDKHWQKIHGEMVDDAIQMRERITQLEWERDQHKKASEEWMAEYDKLKEKHEPGEWLLSEQLRLEGEIALVTESRSFTMSQTLSQIDLLEAMKSKIAELEATVENMNKRYESEQQMTESKSEAMGVLQLHGRDTVQLLEQIAKLEARILELGSNK